VSVTDLTDVLRLPCNQLSEYVYTPSGDYLQMAVTQIAEVSLR
jgi:hypothetical protein